MGKGLGVAEVLGGILLWIIGIALVIGMYAANTIMIVAAPMLIFALILFVLGTVIFWRASLNFKQKSEAGEIRYSADGKRSSI